MEQGHDPKSCLPFSLALKPFPLDMCCGWGDTCSTMVEVKMK